MWIKFIKGQMFSKSLLLVLFAINTSLDMKKCRGGVLLFQGLKFHFGSDRMKPRYILTVRLGKEQRGYDESNKSPSRDAVDCFACRQEDSLFTSDSGFNAHTKPDGLGRPPLLFSVYQ